MSDTKLVRKSLTKILLVQWSRFGAVPIMIKGSTLFAGINGSGKSTILDAVSYVYSGNTQFNKAAQDRDRTVLSYVRGDTKSQGEDQFLRQGNVISYIVLEFFSPADNFYITVGVCIESPDVGSFKPFWFSKTDAKIDDFIFYEHTGKILKVTPKNNLRVKGTKLKSNEFVEKKKGIKMVHRLLGLRCDAEELRRKLVKMMSFKLENNIDKFNMENVLPQKEIKTIDNLKEQKAQFEKIKETYDNILKRQVLLDEVESKMKIFESKQKELDLKRAVMCYQEMILCKNEFEKQSWLLSEEKAKHDRLTSQGEKLSDEMETAEKTKQEAYYNYKQNDLTKGIEDLKNTICEQKGQIKKCKNEIASITYIKNTIKSISDICELNLDTIKILNNFDNVEYDSDEKYKVYGSIKQVINDKNDEFRKEKWSLEGKQNEIENDISDVSESIKQLESKNKDFPREIQFAKDTINIELKNKGISAEVRTLAELVDQIELPEWRDALEVYLKNHKFDLIIDAEYVKDAVEICHRHKFKRAQLVFTDKLKDFTAENNSAASILIVPNKYARRYVNYLLGKIYLCNDLDELYDHPLGGIMTDGTLATAYSMKSMDMSKIDYYLGRDAERLRLEVKKKELSALREEQKCIESNIDKVNVKIKRLNDIDFSVFLRFEAVKEYGDIKNAYSENKKRLEEMENDPTILALSEVYHRAETEYDRIKTDHQKIAGEIGACEKQISFYDDEVKKSENKVKETQSDYDEYITMHLDLKRLSEEEYKRLCKNKSDGIAIKQKTIDNTIGEYNRVQKDMESVQIRYNNMSGRNTEEYGPTYITKFRAERDQLANVDAEDTKNRLEEKQKVLENAFVTDFIADLSEKIDTAKDELAAINNELKDLPFGQDIYEFITKERADKSSFFRIKKKLYDKNFGIDNAYMDKITDDMELQQDIEDFMDMILNDYDENEFIDYRYYFSYDMEITNRISSRDIKTDLSVKQGSASNGEKQTPYYIILAASLMQCYPKRSACARLAFIDEAFAALSQERIEMMVQYLEQNGLQVLYAAPPEKIKSIGSYIDSTVSLVETGRYTNVVEGLVDEFLG